MILGKINNRLIKKEVSCMDKKFRVTADKVTKLSILAVLSGYKKAESISLNEPLSSDPNEMSNFINFLLNHERFSPIKFKLKINYTPQKKFYDKTIKNKIIILASGGIDSTAAILYHLDKGIKPLLISLDFGQFNNKREGTLINRIARKLRLKHIRFKVDIAKEVINGWKQWEYIVPARNFMIASFGAMVLDYLKSNGKIILAATEEEIRHINPGPDKSKRFYKFCTKFYSREYGKNIQLWTPFKHCTKTEILSIWKNKWLKKYKISPYETSTCYRGIECGECNSCFKRSLAFLAAGFDLDKNMKINPFNANKDKTMNYLNRISSKNSTFTDKRRIDTLVAYIVADNKGLLSEDVSINLHKLEKRYKSKISAKINELKINNSK